MEQIAAMLNRMQQPIMSQNIGQKAENPLQLQIMKFLMLSMLLLKR